MKSFILLLIVTISFVVSVPDETCKAILKKDCETCLKISGCAFCKDTKICFAYNGPTSPSPCSVGELQFQTCIGNAKIWLIVFGSVGGVVLVAAIIITWCCCRRCKRRSENNATMRYNADTQKLEDRRAANELRTFERTQAADQIRMKYGIGKGKDTSNDYRRMS